MRTAEVFGALALCLVALPANGVAFAQSHDQIVQRASIKTILAKAKDEMSAKPDVALALTKRAEQLLSVRSKTPELTYVLAEALWLQGEAFLRLGRQEDAASRVERAFALTTAINDRTLLRGEILLSRGWLATQKADVAEALSDYQLAHNIFRALGETRKQAIALRQIAALYREAGDVKTAMRYDAQSTEIYRGDPTLELSALNNLGVAFDELKQFDRAEFEYRRALRVAQKINSKIYQNIVLKNIARVQIEAGKLRQAARTLAEARKFEEGGDRSSITSLTARLALEQKNFGRAVAISDNYFAGVDLKSTEISDRDAHDTAYQAYQAIGRNDLALAHLEALKRLDDKTAGLTASANTALMAARFDTANKDAKIANLKAEEAKRKFEFEQARARLMSWIFGVIIVGALGVVLLLAFGVVTLRRSRNEVRAANVDLAAANGALEKALAAKTEFLATTSHEIRTPLNGILGMTQVMLADQALTASLRDRLDVVRAAGVTMKALVDDILDVAKMETGNMTIESVPVDLPKTMSDVSRLWEEQARAKGVGFKVELADCPRSVQGDPARLRQIVFNLLFNALKFTAHGAITLRAAIEGGNRLVISVSDTGIGIPADKLEEIFESFKQVDAATTRKFGGTGLGLSICRNLARAMGGDISVRSTLGEGSTFAVSIPYQAAVQDLGGDHDPATAADLLIVDAQPIMRSMLKTLFAPHLPTVYVAASIEEALVKLMTTATRRVLVDESAVRAHPDGLAVLRKVAGRAAPGALSVLWATPTDEQRALFTEIAIGQVIEKPIAGPALVAQLLPKSDAPAGRGVARAA